MFQVIQMQARTLAWWFDQREDVDFSPVYQRKSRIWSERDKQFLIDSILNDFDIPKFYLADFTFTNTTLNRANRKFAVIDGKQRFEAIFDFFSGVIVLSRDFELAEDPTLKIGGLSFQDLSRNYPKIARKFENANFTVMSVITDDEAKINELFVRLNTGRPLTGAELRNAMMGRVPELIRQIVEHSFFTQKIRFSTNRSQDKNTVAKLLLIEHRGRFVDTKKSQLDRLVRDVGLNTGAGDQDEDNEVFEEQEAENQIIDIFEQTEGGDIYRSAERVRGVLDKMNCVFLDRDALLASQTSIIPYYWLIRGVEDARIGQVRPFLISFDKSLKENRSRHDRPEDRDAELDYYYTLSRTSNDAASMSGRYRILRQRFDRMYPPS